MTTTIDSKSQLAALLAKLKAAQAGGDVDAAEEANHPPIGGEGDVMGPAAVDPEVSSARRVMAAFNPDAMRVQNSMGDVPQKQSVKEVRSMLERMGLPVGNDPNRIDDPVTKRSLEKAIGKSAADSFFGGDMDLEAMMAILQAKASNIPPPRPPPPPRTSQSPSRGLSGGSAPAPGGSSSSGGATSTGSTSPTSSTSSTPAAQPARNPDAAGGKTITATKPTTLDAVAKQHDVNPAVLQAANPKFEQTGGAVAAGEKVFVPKVDTQADPMAAYTPGKPQKTGATESDQGGGKVPTAKETAYVGGQPIGDLETVKIQGSGGETERMEVRQLVAFAKMKEAAKKEGVDLQITDGFRTMKEQEAVYAQEGPFNGTSGAADPGTSPHQNGIAIDVTDTNGAKAWVAANGGKFGFERTNGEDWHFESPGTRSAPRPSEAQIRHALEVVGPGEGQKLGGGSGAQAQNGTPRGVAPEAERSGGSGKGVGGSVDIARSYLDENVSDLKVDDKDKLKMESWVPNNVNCANFVGSVLEQNGLIKAESKSASVDTLDANLQKAGWTKHPIEEAQKGDAIIYRWASGGQHTELATGNGGAIGARNINPDGSQRISEGKISGSAADERYVLRPPAGSQGNVGSDGAASGGGGGNGVPKPAQRGDQGENVVELQQRLKDRGFDAGNSGKFDQKTQDAVSAFNASQGIDGDKASKETQAALNPLTAMYASAAKDRVHTVKPGDSIDDIARDNNVSVALLRQANPALDQQRTLAAGQKLAIPAVDLQQAPRAAYDATAAAADPTSKMGAVPERAFNLGISPSDYMKPAGKLPPVTAGLPEVKEKDRVELKPVARGDEGAEVQTLQSQLKVRGYDVPNNGKFDDKTATAVAQFNQDQGLKGGQRADRDTLRALNATGVLFGKDAAPQAAGAGKVDPASWRPGPGDVTAAELQQIVPGLDPAKAAEVAPHLNAAMAEAKINTPERKAQFIAQLAHESGGFVYDEEIASGAAYEGRSDLGNTQPGDGERFKGRGFIQVTGRHNYTEAGKALNLDLVNHPELASRPENASRIAAWYWNSHNINQLADRGDVVAVTQAINGGTNGLSDRQAYYARASDVLAA